MKEHPILFNGEMVRAILEGRKLQSRRPVKPQPDEDGLSFHIVRQQWDDTSRKVYKSPFGVPGDILWVRETFITGWRTLDDEIQQHDEDGKELPEKVWYRADNDLELWLHDDGYLAENIPWKPSIHMPRKFARTFLKVKRVWVERVQEISEEDARAEGCGGNLLHDILGPIAKKADMRPGHWVHGAEDESESYCDKCIDDAVVKEKEEHPERVDDICRDGGWDIDSDICEFCKTCEAPLSQTFTDSGALEEFDHHQEHGISDPISAYTMQTILASSGYEFGGEQDHPELSGPVAKMCFRALWDSIYGGTPKEEQPDLSWEANPWVFACEFEKLNM